MSLQADAVIQRPDSEEEFPQRLGEDAMQFCRRIKTVLDADPQALALVDRIGPGAAVLDWLRQHGCRAY